MPATDATALTGQAAAIDALFAKIVHGLDAEYVGSWSIAEVVDEHTRVLRSPKGVLCRVKGTVTAGREWNAREIGFDDAAEREIWQRCCQRVLRRGSTWTHLDSIPVYDGWSERNVVHAVVGLVGRILGRIDAVNVVAKPLIEQHRARVAARREAVLDLGRRTGAVVDDEHPGVALFTHGRVTVTEDGTAATITVTRPLPVDTIAAMLNAAGPTEGAGR